MTRVLLAAALVALAGGWGGTTPASLFVAPAGSDAGACTAAAPCASFQRAFELAAPGAIVDVRAGTYPSQELSGDRGGVVTFRADGGRVRMGGRLTLAGVANVRLVDFDFPRVDPVFDLLLDACNANVTLERSTGRRFFILEGNANVTFLGGSWGGYSSPGDEDSAVGTAGWNGPNRTCDGRPAPPARNIVFDGVVFHDVFWGKREAEWGGAHPDCFEVNGYVDGLTIRNSAFVRCQDSFLAIYTDQGNVSNVTVERTLFKDLGDTTWYGSQWVSSGGRTCGSIVFRNNVWLPNNPNGRYPYSSIRSQCVPAPGEAPAEIVANVFQAPPTPNDCATFTAPPYGALWRRNLFLKVTAERPACVS